MIVTCNQSQKITSSHPCHACKTALGRGDADGTIWRAEEIGGEGRSAIDRHFYKPAFINQLL